MDTFELERIEDGRRAEETFNRYLMRQRVSAVVGLVVGSALAALILLVTGGLIWAIWRWM